MDFTFEDAPFMLDMTLKGGVVPVGGATTGYTWTYVPDINTDTIGTRTLEWGDETVAFQGAFATADTLDLTVALDAALTSTLVGFVQDWVPQTSAFLTTTFAGYTGGLVDRLTESVMGWQHRLFIDPDAVAPGTTWVQGRFRSAQYGIHNQNKRKYFGDGSAVFTKLGRGKRQIHAQVVFEAADQANYADFLSATRKCVRSVYIGTAIAGATGIGNTTGSLTAGVITTIPVAALASGLVAGQAITVGGVTFVVGPAGAAAAATAIPVVSQTIGTTIPTTQPVAINKTIIIDTWGLWDTWTLGALETNTIFTMDFQGMYSTTASKEVAYTIVNGQAAL